MKLLTGAALGAVVLLAPAAAAQGPDARVLPRGVVELRMFGTYTQFTDRFGPDGRVALGTGFDAVIAETAGRLAAAAADSTRVRLEGFFSRTQATTGGDAPLEIAAGTPRARLAADWRDAPLTVALGLSSRLTVEATASLHRRGTVVRGIFMEDADFGLNPDPARNLDILEEVDPVYAARVGVYLPTRNSAAGRELQRRVREISGDTLTLPTLAVPVVGLLNVTPRAAAIDTAEALMLRSRSARTSYYLGDTQLALRLQVARAADGWAAHWDSASPGGFRATVAGRVRLPTGSSSATLFPLQFAPEMGHWGVGGGAAADWFVSRRWWVTAAGDFDLAFPRDVERLDFTAENPFPDSTTVRTMRREPGARMTVYLTPRYRLTREIAFAAQYAFQHIGATTLSGEEADLPLGPIETLDAVTAHSVGVGMSYSTLAAYRAGDSPFPAEVSLLYRNVVAGSGFAPHAGAIEIGARVYAPMLWRNRPPRVQPTDRPTDATPSIPPPDSIPPAPPRP